MKQTASRHHPDQVLLPGLLLAEQKLNEIYSESYVGPVVVLMEDISLCFNSKSATKCFKMTVKTQQCINISIVV
jgi:hypothetical protein